MLVELTPIAVKFCGEPVGTATVQQTASSNIDKIDQPPSEEFDRKRAGECLHTVRMHRGLSWCAVLFIECAVMLLICAVLTVQLQFAATPRTPLGELTALPRHPVLGRGKGGETHTHTHTRLTALFPGIPG